MMIGKLDGGAWEIDLSANVNIYYFSTGKAGFVRAHHRAINISMSTQDFC